ncbi:MAG: hypothetical protein ABSG33_11480 [Candidatus Bathyarchaeia archaeon]
MLIAPILAVALVLSLAAAVSYLPVSSQVALQNKPSAALTPTPSQKYSNVTPGTSSSSAGSYTTATPAPTSAAPPIAAPTTVPSNATTSINIIPFLSVAAAVVLGVVAALLFFSEKSLKKELGTDVSS